VTTSRFTIPFDELSLDQVELVGGKSAHLGDLLRAGFPVPPGFAITALAFDRVVQPGDDRAALVAREMPSEVASEIATAYAALGRRVGRDEPPVAVRSSAVAEDAADASFAGVQDTYLWLSGLEEVLRGVQRCWASYFNPEATAYRAQHADARTGMSVAVQFMVDARVAGVMFTLNPVSGDPSSIAIDASYGLGTTVVGGEVTPDSYLVSKVTREVVRSVVGAKEIECVAAESDGTELISVDSDRRARLCLEPAEIASLVELARQVEAHYGRHQDLEWAIDRRLGEVFLLQSRPETVWSQKRRTQPAVAPDALSAIAATFLRGAQRDRQQ
jgi:phosphoenolpyruvate synthase/pyruvate phosphate dikinase